LRRHHRWCCTLSGIRNRTTTTTTTIDNMRMRRRQRRVIQRVIIPAEVAGNSSSMPATTTKKKKDQMKKRQYYNSVLLQSGDEVVVAAAEHSSSRRRSLRNGGFCYYYYYCVLLWALMMMLMLVLLLLFVVMPFTTTGVAAAAASSDSSPATTTTTTCAPAATSTNRIMTSLMNRGFGWRKRSGRSTLMATADHADDDVPGGETTTTTVTPGGTNTFRGGSSTFGAASATSGASAGAAASAVDGSNSNGMPANIIRVAYQGEPGAYSEKATRELLGQKVLAVGRPNFEACFRAVASMECDYACLPIENSLGGSIHDNYDLMLRYDLTIIAEHEFRVHHCLLAKPGVKREQIKYAISHPQALAQCDNFLRGLNIQPIPTYDTAGSAKMIAEGQKLPADCTPDNTAAIASDLAGKT